MCFGFGFDITPDEIQKRLEPLENIAHNPMDFETFWDWFMDSFADYNKMDSKLPVDYEGARRALRVHATVDKRPIVGVPVVLASSNAL